MRKGKGLLVTTLVGATLASAITGCSSQSVSSTQEVASNEQEMESKKENESTEGEVVELRFLSWLSAHEELDKKVAEAYKEINPNVNVTFEYHGDMTATEYYKKVDLMLMGGEEVDIVMASAFAEHTQRADSGTYLELDSFFETEGVVPEEAYSLAPRVENTLYGIPGDLKSWFVMINKDLLDEKGLEVPSLDWTWDDYREYAIQLTEGEGVNKRYGSYFHSWDHYYYLGMWSNYEGNPMFKEDMSGVNFDHPMFKEWLQFRYDMENTDMCQVPLVDVKALNMNYRDKFFNEQIAMLPIGTFMVAELDDQDKYPHDFVTTFAPMPAWNDAEPGSTYTDSHFYSIAKNSKHPQEAYDFIRFYTTEGMKIKGVSVSGEAGINQMEFMEMQIDDPQYVDMETLESVMNNPEWKNNYYENVPGYNKELSQMMVDEFSKFLLGTESLDTVIEILMKNGNQLMEDKN